MTKCTKANITHDERLQAQAMEVHTQNRNLKISPILHKNDGTMFSNSGMREGEGVGGGAFAYLLSC